MRNTWNSPSARLCAALFSVVAIVDVALVLATPVSISPGTFPTAFALVLCIGSTALVGYAAIWRLRHDETRPARLIKTVCRSQIEAMTVLAAFTLLSLVMAIASFATNALAMPLQDDVMTAVDRFLGFDWIAITSWVGARPFIAQVLAWSYWSCMQQMAFISLFLVATCRFPDLWDFLAVLMLGLGLTLLVAGLLPAASPAVYLQPDASLLEAMARVGATYNYAGQFAALRDGSLNVFIPGDSKGIITFPSYHVVVALTLIYAVRHWRVLFWPAVALNTLVIGSAVPIGGHYVVDLVGGVVIFAVCVAAVDWANARRGVGAWLYSRSPLLIPASSKSKSLVGVVFQRPQS